MPVKKTEKNLKTSASTPSIFARIWTAIKSASTSLTDWVKKIFDKISNKFSRPKEEHPLLSKDVFELKSKPTPIVHPEPQFRDDSDIPETPAATQPKPIPAKPAVQPVVVTPPTKPEKSQPIVVPQTTPDSIAALKKQIEALLKNEQIKQTLEWVKTQDLKTKLLPPHEMKLETFTDISDKLKVLQELICKQDEKQVASILTPAIQKELQTYLERIPSRMKGIMSDDSHKAQINYASLVVLANTHIPTYIKLLNAEPKLAFTPKSSG